MKLSNFVLHLGMPVMVVACSPGLRAAAAADRVTGGSAVGVAVAVGSHHTCATVDDHLRCWGDNRTGALGDGSTDVRDAPVAVTVERAEAGDRLVAGQGFSCVLRRAKLRCWGSLARHPPGPVGARDVADGVVAAAAHGPSLCVVRSSGGVACTRAGPDVLPLRDLPGVANAAAVTMSARAMCTLDRGGAVACLGLPYDGPVRAAVFVVPERVIAVNGLADVAEIALVDTVLVARRKNGTVVAVLLPTTPRGAPPTAPQPQTMTPLAGLADAIAIAPFGHQVCGVRARGSVVCVAPFASPSAPSVLDIGAVAIAGGSLHACAALKTGGVKCWGEGSYGQVRSVPSGRAPRPEL